MMRALCFIAATVGAAAAFVPSSIPSSSRISCGQHRNFDCAASTRRTRTAPATAAGGVAAAEAVEKSGAAEGSSGSVGVIVCDHGSRRKNANEMLFEVAERYRSFSGFEIVEVGSNCCRG